MFLAGHQLPIAVFVSCGPNLTFLLREMSGFGPYGWFSIIILAVSKHKKNEETKNPDNRTITKSDRREVEDFPAARLFGFKNYQN